MHALDLRPLAHPTTIFVSFAGKEAASLSRNCHRPALSARARDYDSARRSGVAHSLRTSACRGVGPGSEKAGMLVAPGQCAPLNSSSVLQRFRQRAVSQHARAQAPSGAGVGEGG